ncbi:MAG: substrate-binding domain-containing protein, partial [Oscillibacter sp.]|nr:substrate-binding domain-containing protein [Oscillibacter sp.]
MKKLPLLLCLLLSLSACGGGGANRADIFRDLRDIQLTVFVDASLSDAFGAAAARYRQDYPEIRLNAQFGPSGALLTRVLDGEQCDIFLSASADIMDALDILPDTRADFLENRLVLAVPAGNPRGIRNFAHMASLIRQGGALFAAANPGDPLGAYTRKLFAYHFLGETALSRGVTYAPDAR